MSDLVERLRKYGDDPYDVSLGEIAEWFHKSADRIEKLERELRECRMQSISDGCQLQDYAEQLSAEKALADRLYDEHYGGDWCDVAEAYRKARGVVMQRYTPYVDYENLHDDVYDITVSPETDGAWVLYSEARAEIERLEKEVERYRELNEKNKEVAAKVVLQKFELMEKLEDAEDTAWNDAIEAAADQCGHHLSTEDDVILANDIADRIRALKRPTP